MPSPFTHRAPRNWLKICLTSPAQQTETITTHLTEITGNGTESMTVEKGIMIISYLEKDANYPAKKSRLDNYLHTLSTAYPKEISIERSTLVEENWAEQWKSQYKPTRISPTFTVVPSWESYSPGPLEHTIEIDPGLAFGTGLHASTRLALYHLENINNTHSPDSVLDVGTGSGILAIAAAKLGVNNLVAIDNDPDAVEAARLNIERNHCDIALSSTPLANINGQFNLVIANITADVLTLLSTDLCNHLTPHGALILAGILTGGQGDKIINTFNTLNLTLADQYSEGEWTSFLFTN